MPGIKQSALRLSLAWLHCVGEACPGGWGRQLEASHSQERGRGATIRNSPLRPHQLSAGASSSTPATLERFENQELLRAASSVIFLICALRSAAELEKRTRTT